MRGDWGVQGVFYEHENPGNGRGPIPEQPYFTKIILRDTGSYRGNHSCRCCYVRSFRSLRSEEKALLD